MANEYPARPEQDGSSRQGQDQEPRTREGSYKDRRYENEGRYDPRYGDQYGKRDTGGVWRNANDGYDRGYGGNPNPRYDNPGHGQYGSNGPWEPRPYYGRQGGYAGHVDVDPELFRHLVQVVRELDGRYEREGNPRKSDSPRVRHYLINTR